ncbi:hypothetical protein [Scytonema sp. NUACC26]
MPLRTIIDFFKEIAIAGLKLSLLQNEYLVSNERSLCQKQGMLYGQK